LTLTPYPQGYWETPLVRDILENGRDGDPAVYWIEIKSEHSAEQIRTGYQNLKMIIGDRKIPAINKHYDKESKILYVGKGKFLLAGRMYIHLGYEQRPVMQGLNLCRWDYTGELTGLQLQLNIIYLPKNLEMLASVLELKIARKLRPILGKHR